jgi:hypothetical protein
VQSPLKIIKVVITVTRSHLGYLLGLLWVAEAGTAVVEVTMIDYDVLSRHMSAIKHLMMEPEHLNPL